MESAGGRGLSNALGMAGFTNVDVVRNPTLGSAPYIARACSAPCICLEHKRRRPGAYGDIAFDRKLPVRRLEVRAGKMSLADYFDVNGVGSDSHLQFLNWTAVNDGAYDYAADTRGYTVAAMVEYQDRNWGVRFAEALMPKVANGPDLDLNVARARSENIELEFRPELHKKHGVVRLLSYVNHANMGSYQAAVDAFLEGIDPTPNIVAHRQQSRVKYGFGLNFEQEISKNVRAFGRVGWNEGQNESFAYTEDDQETAAGADWRLERWKRPNDKTGTGSHHERYFKMAPALSGAGREWVSAGRRTADLWSRRHSGDLLHGPSVARSVHFTGAAMGCSSRL